MPPMRRTNSRSKLPSLVHKNPYFPVVGYCASPHRRERPTSPAVKANAVPPPTIAFRRAAPPMIKWRRSMNKTDREALRIAYEMVLHGPDKRRAKDLMETARTDGF